MKKESQTECLNNLNLRTEDSDKEKNKEKREVKHEERKMIRSYYKKQRDEMPAALASRLSLEISGLVLDWELYQQAETVFFYYPLGNEVSLLPVMEQALRTGKQAAFPKTDGEHMEFYKVTDLKQLQEGSFHVMEPPCTDTDLAVKNPDICFVPGIVFDRAGGRFGYGRGYYDRYFADKYVDKMERCTIVGCAYDCQIAGRLPVHVWDVAMDYLVSEHGIIKACGGKE